MYKGNPISAWIVKRFIHSPVFGLPNIVLKKSIMPEHIQYNVDADTICASLLPLMLDDNALNTQRSALAYLRPALLVDKQLSPSQIAAQHIIKNNYTARNIETSSS